LVVVDFGNAVEIGVPAVVDMESIVGPTKGEGGLVVVVVGNASTGVAFNAARITGSCSAFKVAGSNSAARPSGSSEFNREDKPLGMITAFGSREIALPLAMVDVFLSDTGSLLLV
jgi:hypothetical protein